MTKLKFAPQERFNRSHRKENRFQKQFTLVAYSKQGFREIITLRIYGTNAMNYAALWVNTNDQYASGTGSAGGYGYHRPSAAAQEAFNNAGFSGFEPIDGRGESAVRDLMETIGRKLFKIKNCYILESHG